MQEAFLPTPGSKLKPFGAFSRYEKHCQELQRIPVKTA